MLLQRCILAFIGDFLRSVQFMCHPFMVHRNVVHEVEELQHRFAVLTPDPGIAVGDPGQRFVVFGDRSVLPAVHDKPHVDAGLSRAEMSGVR